MSGFRLAEEEERPRKRAPWGVIALVLLTGLALVRNGSGEFDIGPPQPATAAAADSVTPKEARPNLSGWFSSSVSPGENGTAVLVGHVDNKQGPAVFYRLGAVSKGSLVEVQRQDGKLAVFEVYGVEVFAKNNFPGERVYGNTGTPEVRVITCGGGFSKQNGYDGNVVVFARLVEVR